MAFDLAWFSQGLGMLDDLDQHMARYADQDLGPPWVDVSATGSHGFSQKPFLDVQSQVLRRPLYHTTILLNVFGRCGQGRIWPAHALEACRLVLGFLCALP